jgi:transposase InsO family protein
MDLKLFNHKKIQRIMNKYGLKAIIRKKKMFSNFSKYNLGNKLVVNNILNREFKQTIPNQFFSTDITYLYYGNKKQYLAFLSVIKDIASGEIIAFKLSQKMNLDLVLETLDNLVKKQSGIKISKPLLHSDQGFQYTSYFYHRKLKKLNITPSMSRKGNSIDNAIIETFFGHLKDEIDFKDINSFPELERVINEYMLYFNNKRPQWDKNKMTPVEYRNHLINCSA